MTCRQAIEEVFATETGVLRSQQVIERIYSKYPDKPWQERTIRAELIGLSVNHASSPHYPNLRQHAFLFSLGNGRYRKWNPDQDGTWIVTDQGVQLVDQSDEAQVEELEVTAVDTSLSLERDLERSLLTGLEQLEPGFRPYREKGAASQEVDTGEVGRIDILGVDEKGDFVVVEVKAGRADDRVCGQILRYMGWVKANLAGARRVRGIVVANEFSDALKYAVKAMPDVALKRYAVRFTFTDIV